MADRTVKATVTGTDVYRWVDADGTIQEAYRGDEIEVTEAEFGRSPGALTGKDDFSAFPTTQEGLDALAAANGHNFPQHVRTVQEKIKDLVDADIDPGSGPSAKELGYPSKQADLDQLAAANGYTWPDGVATVTDKQAALMSAGISPE